MRLFRPRWASINRSWPRSWSTPRRLAPTCCNGTWWTAAMCPTWPSAGISSPPAGRMSACPSRRTWWSRSRVATSISSPRPVTSASSSTPRPAPTSTE